MSPDTAALLARITQTTDDLRFTEANLHRQRLILRDAATSLRLGESPQVVVSRLKAAKVWAIGTVPALREARVS